jgi:outer membrane protein assembly factor BamB
MKKKIIALFIVILLIAIALSISNTVTGYHYSVLKDRSSLVKGEANITNLNDDWPMYCHDLYNSGFSNSEAPETFNLCWSSYCSATPYSISAANGNLFSGLGNGDIICVDAFSGEIIWKCSTDDGYNIFSAPCVFNGKVYVGTFEEWGDKGYVYCIDEITGKKIWRYEANDCLEGSPAVSDGKVYIGSMKNYDGHFYCLDANTGKKIWTYKPGESIVTSPAVAYGKVYFGSHDDHLYCLDADTGEKIWAFFTNYSDIYSSPVICNNKLYFGTSDSPHDDNFYCLDAITGEKIWSYRTNHVIMYPSAVAYGKVYFLSDDLYCLNADNGEFIWKFDAPLSLDDEIVIADGKVYFEGDENEYCAYLCCLDAITGEIISDYLADDWITSIIIAYDKLYVTQWDFKILCFGKDDNIPPNKPLKPIGEEKGAINSEYTYETSTIDPDGDQVHYMWDWGDGTTSDWLGPYPSDEVCKASHKWDEIGAYEIRVKAKDEQGCHSEWSAPLPVTMPRTKVVSMIFFLELSNLFQLLKHIL